MLYAALGLIVLAAFGSSLYALINKSETTAQISALRQAIEEQEVGYTAEVDRLNAELAKLEKLKHIPNVIERSRRLEAEIAAKLTLAQKHADETVLIAHKEVERMKQRVAARQDEAQQRAFEIIQAATLEANRLKQSIMGETEADSAKAKEALRVVEWQANNNLEDAQKKAREIASLARKEAKERTQKVEETLARATAYALNIREKAEARAREIGGQAYEALRRHEFYEGAATAMQNVVGGYADIYLVPASHVLDELAEEFGFHHAGVRLKIARERTRIMEKGGAAATCDYSEGWKREYAINFVLGAFNGKVDSILARLKPANQGKLVQEIKDVYALANHNGEVFKNARIHEEYLEARLEELRWAVAVQRLKEKEREEQRAIREQIRDEERARNEIERAIRQAEREEETITKAIARIRLEYESANAEYRGKFESKLGDLAEKLRVAEEKNRRAASMAQQTKRGNVYVISNIGSFGEDVYKIGLTRRLDPKDRVQELSSASVPFGFDIHGIIEAEDAPALEASLHRKFIPMQVNKVNRRKEFFRVSLREIRKAVEDLGFRARWTEAAAAREYRDTSDLEAAMRKDEDLKWRWTADQAKYVATPRPDDEESEAADSEAEQTEDAVERCGR